LASPSVPRAPPPAPPPPLPHALPVLLFLDYAIGHRWRGSAPAAWRRFRRWTEFIGWWQVLIALIIALYYAMIRAISTCHQPMNRSEEHTSERPSRFALVCARPLEKHK